MTLPPRVPPFPPQPPPAAVIDVGRTDARKAVIGSVAAGALGMVACCSGLTGAVEGGAGAAIVVVIGVVLLVIASLPLLMHRKVFRPRRLIIEPAGIRWDDPRGKPWAVAWPELFAVSISKHGAMAVPETVSDRIVGAVSDRVAGERALVRIDLFPADPGFHQRHPQMVHLWWRDRYRLSLGQNAGLVPQIDAAIRHFQPARYRGVEETEGFMGLR